MPTFIKLDGLSGSTAVRASAIVAVEPDPDHTAPGKRASRVFVSGVNEPLIVHHSVEQVRRWAETDHYED